MYKTKEWRKKRVIAHWILKQILPDALQAANDKDLISIAGNGSVQITLSDKTTQVFKYVDLPVSNLYNNDKGFTSLEIDNAINLLVSNGHVTISYDRNKKERYIKGNDKAKIADEESYYISQSSVRWYDEHPIWKDILLVLSTALLSLLVGWLLIKAESKENKEQYEVLQQQIKQLEARLDSAIKIP